MPHNLVLLRHGQSQWNLENRFTGWVDVDLSLKGIEEARSAGQVLGQNGYEFDLAMTSVLKRAIRTLWLVLEELDQMWLPVISDWRLNERHYGGLQGLNKKETAEKYGEDQVHFWRRGYDVRPPSSQHSEENQPKYPGLVRVPKTESLVDTSERVIQYWHQCVCPELLDNKRIIIVGHGNSLRALIKYLENISDDGIMSLNIPTGIPLVYRLDDSLQPIENFYLADEEVLNKAVDTVKNQTTQDNQ